MKRTKRSKLMAVLLAVTMLMTMVLPTLVFAEGEPAMSGTCGATENDYVIWELTQNNEDNDNPTYTLTISGTGAMIDFADDNAAPWKAAWSSDFKKIITKIVIGKDITVIGQRAFVGCAAVTDVTFEQGSQLQEIRLNGFPLMTSLKEITMPSTLHTIGGSAFFGCSALEKVILQNPDNLTIIGDSAFGRCSNLKYFNNPEEKQDCEIMPASVKKIEYHAFYACSQLIGQITIPAAIEKLSGSFDGCSSISKVSFENGSKLKTIGKVTFASVGISEITLPEGLEIIDENAFNGTHLTAIEIPASVTKIGKFAFRCDKSPTLATVTFAEGSQLKEIGTSAFGTALASITLPEGLTTIAESAFKQSKLQYITIPSTVTSIGNSAFNLSCPIAINLSAVSDTASITGCCKGGLTHGSMVYLPSEKAKELVGTPYNGGKPVWLITNGGVVPEQEFVKYGLATPERPGYRFDGWYKEKDFSGTPVTSINSTHNGGIRYAKWIGHIDFDANGGEGSMESQEITTHVDNTLNAMTGLSREGYEFSGWNTKKDGTGAFYKDADVIKPLENTTLYAQWANKIGEGNNSYFVYDLQDQTYTGAEVEPKVIVKNALTWDTVSESDYRVEYKDNINTGTARVTVTKGSNSIELEFKIIKDENPTVSLEPVSVTYGTDYIMTATAKTSAGNNIENADITIQYYTDEQCMEGETTTAPVNVGQYWAKATLVGTDNYAEKSVITKITIAKADQSISYATTTVDKHINDGVFTNELTKTTVDGEITYTSSNPAVATVNETTGEVTIVGAGTATITATAAETDNYNSAAVSYTLTVKNHSYTDVVTPPTCTEQGYTTHTCSACGDTYKDNYVDATEHSFTNYVSNDDATCTQDGTKTAACDNGCGEKDTRTDTDSKLGHDMGAWETVTSPDCTNKGSQQRKCSRCDYTETKDVDPNGHDWEDDFTTDKEAACTTDGSKSIHCKKCDVVKDSTVIPAIQHSFTNYVSNNDATCTEDGTKTATCDNGCGTIDTIADTGSATGHTYDDSWKSNESKHWQECTVCSEKSEAAAHTFEWITDKEASETENGSKHEECSVCHFKKDAVEIPATGTPEQPGDGDTSGGDNENPSKPDTDTPQTGDNRKGMLLFFLLAVSAASMGAVLLISGKRCRLSKR